MSVITNPVLWCSPGVQSPPPRAAKERLIGPERSTVSSVQSSWSLFAAWSAPSNWNGVGPLVLKSALNEPSGLATGTPGAGFPLLVASARRRTDNALQLSGPGGKAAEEGVTIVEACETNAVAFPSGPLRVPGIRFS